MMPFIFAMSSISLWILHADSRTKYVTFLACTFLSITFFILVGFRTASLGSDYENYRLLFEHIDKNSSKAYNSHFDVGFISLSSFFLDLTDNIKGVFVLYAVMAAFLLRQISNLYHIHWYMIAVPYIAMFALSRDASQFRFSVACLGALYFGLIFLLHRKPLNLAVGAVFATIHFATLPVLLALTAPNYMQRFTYITQLIFCITLFSILKVFSATAIGLLYPRAIDYFYTSISYAGLAKALFIYLLCHYQCRGNDSRQSQLLTLLTIALSLRIVFYDLALLTNRIASGIETITVILIALNVKKSRKNVFIWAPVLLIFACINTMHINLKVLL